MLGLHYFVLIFYFLTVDRENWVVILQAAASMVVNVGSFSDPKGLEGLAHFLGVSTAYVLMAIISSFLILLCVRAACRLPILNQKLWTSLPE